MCVYSSSLDTFCFLRAIETTFDNTEIVPMMMMFNNLRPISILLVLQRLQVP